MNNNSSVSEMNSLSHLLTMSCLPYSQQHLSEDDIHHKMLQLKTQNDAIYETILTSQQDEKNREIENEFQVIRNSLQDLKRDLRGLDARNSACFTSSASSCSYFTRPSFERLERNSLTSHDSRNHRQQHYPIAATPQKPSRNSCQHLMGKHLQYYERKSNVIVYIPLPQLLNSTFLRQNGRNSLQLFQIFKVKNAFENAEQNGQIGDPKNYAFLNDVQTDLLQAVTLALEKPVCNATYVFLMMKGTHRKHLASRVFETLRSLLGKPDELQISYAELIYSSQPTGVEPALRKLLLRHPELELMYSIEELEYAFEQHQHDMTALKNLIKGQIQLQQPLAKKKWIQCRHSLKRDILIAISYREDNVIRKMNFAFVSNGRLGLQEQFSVKPSSIISPSKDYFELLSDILSMDLRKIFILALNPLAKLSRNLEELLQAAKEIER